MGSPETHTSALNDILFILLLFFLIVSTLANPNVIKVFVPKAQNNTKAKQTVVVSINKDNQFFVGTKPVSPDSLQVTIERMVAKSDDAEPTVVVNGDSVSTLANFAVVLRATHALKLKTVLAVDKLK